MEYVREGEITTTFEDVAERVGELVEVEETLQQETADLVMRELDRMTIADIVREAISASDIEEVESLIEIMKQETE